LKSFRDERKGMKEKIVTDWKNESEGEDGKKMEGIKRGGITICHRLFVSNPCNYEFANDGKVSLFSFLY
jgi:hypothetical protein